MRLGVLGDTHGELRAARALIGRMGAIEILLHTGDYHEDAMLMAHWPELAGVAVHAVLGNGDYGQDGPRQALLDLAGHRILLVHGHRLGVKQGLQQLVAEALRRQADVAVFGHTHVPRLEERDGVLLLNPGSTRYPRLEAPASAAVLELAPGKREAELLELD